MEKLSILTSSTPFFQVLGSRRKDFSFLEARTAINPDTMLTTISSGVSAPIPVQWDRVHVQPRMVYNRKTASKAWVPSILAITNQPVFPNEQMGYLQFGHLEQNPPLPMATLSARVTRFTSQQAWYHEIEYAGFVVHDTTGQANHRDFTDMSEHEHRSRSTGAP